MKKKKKGGRGYKQEIQRREKMVNKHIEKYFSFPANR